MDKRHGIECTNILFENFFRPKQVLGPISIEYRKKCFIRYMPIGKGRFLVGHEIVRKEDLCMTSTTSNTSTLVPINEPMLGGHMHLPMEK
jgi:hypothetical protein